METIFTKEEIYDIIEIWYGHDDIFTLMAKGLVHEYLAKGLNIDGCFISEIIRLGRNWCDDRAVV